MVLEKTLESLLDCKEIKLLLKEGLGQEEKGTIEDEMAGWHHGLDGRESQ